jgi:hypothetical protein
VNKYIRVMKNLRKTPARPAHIVEEADESPGLEIEEEDPEHAELI